MSINRKNHLVSNETRLNIATAINKGKSVIVINNNTALRCASELGCCAGEIKIFISIRKVAEYINIHPSYIAKSISLNKFYLGRGFLVYMSYTTHEEILNSESYKVAISENKLKNKHSEESKDLIRKANLGKKLSLEIKQKISLNSGKAKPVLVINNNTKETL
jgi:hypothetical protein